MEKEKNIDGAVHAGNLIRKYELLDEILESVREKNEFHALAVMNDRNEVPMADIMKSELLQWQYECIQIKALLELTVRRMGVREIFLNSSNTEFMHRISSAERIEDCKKINIDMVHRYCSLAILNDKKNYSPLVQRILFMIDIDLTRALTLQYFADVLNVNKCYLSDLFRRETGTTITEYVTVRRIERASDLLLMTQQTVQMISEQVGILDVHYFNRLFKKKRGMTPGQYREHREKGTE